LRPAGCLGQRGLGIGLALERRLVELHCGSVRAFSDGKGRGSEFIVQLPIASDQAGSDVSESPAPPRATSPCRILVVDDHVDSAASLAMLFHITCNETATAHDGVFAIETAERFRPDVILLDIGLPQLNGYDVCRRIREMPWDAGFDVHVVKPASYDDLMRILAAREPPQSNDAEALTIFR
jgi:CheY-like chemotaxis protein